MYVNRVILGMAALAVLIVLGLYAGASGSTSPRLAQAVLPVGGGETAQAAEPGASSAAIIALEVQGVTVGYFSNVTGLGGENEVKEKTAGLTVITEPGALHWDRIVLSRGLSEDTQLSNWRRQVETGQIATARKSISVIFLNQELVEVARFDVAGAWPCRYQVDPLTEASLGFTESLTVCHNGFVRVR